MVARKATAKPVETAPASRFARKPAGSSLPGVTRGRPAADYDPDLLAAIRESFADSVPFGVPVAELAPVKQGEAFDKQYARAQSVVRRHVEAVNAADGVRYGVSFGVDGTELWFAVAKKIEGRGRKPKAASV